MIHLQAPVNDWLEAVDRLPDGAVVKAIDNVQALAEAKTRRPEIRTLLRHWYDQAQVFGGTYEENKARARAFYQTFVDGTFDQYAAKVDYIQEWNEYIASSHTAAERAARVLWAKAAADVWKNEYRSQAKYAHIRLVICETAVGNDIPWEHAQTAAAYDCLVGYHAYRHYINGQLDPGDWFYHSGRWVAMDADYRARGYHVDWLFGEAGPYGGVLEGWKHPNVLGGDAAKYVASVRLWIQQVRATPAYQADRVKGFCLFTTGGGFTWQYYETRQPELNQLAEMTAEEWTVPPQETWNKKVVLVPQDTSEEEFEEARRYIWSTKTEIAWSANSAYSRPPDVGEHEVVVPNPERWGGVAALEAWQAANGYAEYDPPTAVTYTTFDALNPDTNGPTIVDIVDALEKHPTKEYGTRAVTAITTLTIHHTVSNTTPQAIASYHVNSRGWPGIGYHFVVMGDGTIYQTNYLETVSYHAGSAAPGDENLISVGVALMGDFTSSPPPQAQQDAARSLVGYLKGMLGVETVLGHRQMPGASTACPGATWPQWLAYVAGE